MKPEQISAFMDNESDVQTEKEILNQWRTDSRVRECWDEYHLIGEVLRDREIKHIDLSKKIFDALADEPTIFVPQNKRTKSTKDAPLAKWVAIAAAVFVVVITTQTVKQNSFKFNPNQIAQSLPDGNINRPMVNAANDSVTPTPKDVNSYVNLHRQWSPFTDIQTVEYNSGVVVSR